jgi:peptidyl-prolyl cis-trans isomerase A (cyclophilin A)
LIKAGYYDGARFFRVVPGFVAQFGLAADPAVTAKWKDMNLQDDPVKESNTPGTLTYATAGPNTRTTQLFINLGNNQRLDGMGFAPFAKVVSGMEAVQAINAGYGEAPQQPLIEAQGNAYLQSQFPQLDYIKKATIQ